jgi:hypothetical protein
MQVAIVNQSTLISNTDLETICAAIQIQVDLHFAPAWQIQPVQVKFYADSKQVPNWAWTLFVIDSDASVAGALGYHQDASDHPDGYVMCQPILSNGGTTMVYDKSNPGQYTISGTISHEALELIMNRFTNLFADNGASSWCKEVADPVEQIGYPISVNGVEVSVSDFVFPNFFNPMANASNMPFNYLKTLTAPFTILSGGYAIQRTGGPGTETQVFGRDMPEWRIQQKRGEFARAYRVMNQKTPNPG